MIVKFLVAAAFLRYGWLILVTGVFVKECVTDYYMSKPQKYITGNGPGEGGSPNGQAPACDTYTTA